jgi:DNA-binding MarR family transcriptional regulator
MTSTDSLNELTGLLRQVLLELTHAVDRTLVSRALTLAKAMPLVALLDGDRHTSSSIARQVRCDAGAMTRTIDELEDRGLITRARSLDDRRVVHLQLTETGQEVARDVPAVLQEAMAANLACLADDERQMLTGLLRRVCAHAQATGTVATHQPDVSAPRTLVETHRQAA